MIFFRTFLVVRVVVLYNENNDICREVRIRENNFFMCDCIRLTYRNFVLRMFVLFEAIENHVFFASAFLYCV